MKAAFDCAHSCTCGRGDFLVGEVVPVVHHDRASVLGAEPGQQFLDTLALFVLDGLILRARRSLSERRMSDERLLFDVEPDHSALAEPVDAMVVGD